MSTEEIDLSNAHCEACEGIAEALSERQIENLLPQVSGWEIVDGAKKMKKSYQFKDFYQTMAFVNAIAWIANTENHHPDLEMGYNYCHITFMTHAIDGLTHNDFICAAKIDKLSQ